MKRTAAIFATALVVAIGAALWPASAVRGQFTPPGANGSGTSAGGDLSGSFPNPTVAKIGGNAVSTVAGGTLHATQSVAVPASDLICAHAGDTTINSLTCTNVADAGGAYQNFAATWAQAASFWTTGRTVQICGVFENWATGTTPTYLMQLTDEGTALYQPLGTAAAAGVRAGAGFTACWLLASQDGTSHVVTQPLGLGSIPGNTSVGQYANTIAQPINLAQGAHTVSIGVQFSSTGLKSGTYTSGISTTGTLGQTCTLGTFNNGNTLGTATVALTGTNTIAGGTALVITNTGNSSTSAATSATATNGTATCSGTATIATVLGGAQGNGVWLQSLQISFLN